MLNTCKGRITVIGVCSLLILYLISSFHFRHHTSSGFQKINLKPVDADYGNSVAPRERADECEESSPTQGIFLTKVEKTGSTTLSGILSRYAISHKLNILCPIDGAHIKWKLKKGRRWDIGPRTSEKADVVIGHAVYNQSMIDKYVVPGYKHIAIVREPVSWMKSAVSFFGSKVGKATPDNVIQNDRKIYIKRPGTPEVKTYLHLNQLQWYGFDYEQRSNITAIENFVSWTVKITDVIVLTDLYDASLVILRKRFCWKYSDIFYQKHVVRSYRRSIDISNGAKRKLLSSEVNLGDKILYDKLNETWWKQPELKEENFWDEVKHFTKLNIDVSNKWCVKVKATKKVYTIASSKWHEQIDVTPLLCRGLKASPYEAASKYAFKHHTF